jgi:hypothetical protein
LPNLWAKVALVQPIKRLFYLNNIAYFGLICCYIAKQQKTLANRQSLIHNGLALGTFTGVGAYPPKPPPLVEP